MLWKYSPTAGPRGHGGGHDGLIDASRYIYKRGDKNLIFLSNFYFFYLKK